MLEKARRAFFVTLSAFTIVGGVALMNRVPPAAAVPIQGQTPAGQFQTVGVSTSGYLQVAIGTGTTSNVTLSGPFPVPIHIDSTTPNFVVVPGTVPVSVVGGIVANITVGICSTVTTAHKNVTTSQVQIYAADATRCQSLICNGDPVVVMYVGATGVTTGTGLAIQPGSCFSPDSPQVFQGALFAISTGAATTGSLSLFSLDP